MWSCAVQLPRTTPTEEDVELRTSIRRATASVRRPVVLALVLCAAVAIGACDGDTGGLGDDGRITITPGDREQPPGAETGSPDLDDEDVDELVDSDCEDRDLRPTEDNIAAVEAATLCLVNAERRHRDVAELEDNDALTTSARRKSRHMVERRYFAHVGPDDRDVRDWVEGTGYISGVGSFVLGENLGWASEGAAVPERIVLGWLQSPSHRRNMLSDRYTDSGIGVAIGAPREEGGGGATYTHHLGAR